MADPIYFQWQNEFLLRTIYPLRETKLRDFLQYYFEIEIWQKYKDLQPQDLAGEIQIFRSGQKNKVLEAYDSFHKLAAYLLDEDVADQYRTGFPSPDIEIMAKINDLHKIFKRFYPTYQNPVKEKYFTSERARQLEELRKRIQTQINDKTRVLRNIMPGSTLKPTYESEIARLSNISLKMVDQELSRLYDFLKAYARLEVYKTEAQKRKAASEKERTDGIARLRAVRGEIEALENRLAQAQRVAKRLSAPPDLEAIKAYFLDDDVTDVYQSKFPAIDAAAILKINDLHKSFKTWIPTYKNSQLEKNFLAQRLTEFENLRKTRAQELAEKQRAASWILPNSPGWAANEKAIENLKNNIVRALDEELGRLYDLQWAYDYSAKTPAAISSLVAQNQKEQADLETQLQAKRNDAAALETSQVQLDKFLSQGEKELMLALVDTLPVTTQDIARSKVEAYRAELAQKTHQQLLEAVTQRFLAQPERYPLWLQYMVIHFSGMRYQSAHGSWADPKDLLLSLRIKAVQDELKREGQEAVNAICEQRLLCYQSAQSAAKVLGNSGDEEVPPPALALTNDPRWQSKVSFHLKALDPARGYYRNKALLDLRIDEEDYDIERMTTQQALDALESIKDQLPDWMWKEIVKVTDLRLKEVHDAAWEQTTPDDLSERYSRQMEPYREILQKWKQDHLTGWREEHDRTSQLIVTRAVCNEVAEHIQHLRGLSPSGGLTAKPEWYMHKEKEPRWAGASNKPFFIKPKNAADFKVGASILWLQWVNKEPNPWQIARPLVLKTGEELIPTTGDANTRITNTGSSFLRDASYQVKDSSGATVTRTDHQWLRWLHEATVVETAETMDGPTVLTFETALPYEDKRQSTIGVFKHFAGNLKHSFTPSSMTATFVGYVPESDVPYDSLQDMLDWNHILLKNVCTPEQTEQYWSKVTRPPQQPVSFDMAVFAAEYWMETVPTLSPSSFTEQTACYETDPKTGAMIPYSPAVFLKRGTRLRVNKDEAQPSGGETYFPITQCDAEPRAESLYIRAAEVIDVPPADASRAFKAKADIPLSRICGVDEKGRPVFENCETGLARETKVRVSLLQKAGPGDLGDGVIRGKGRQAYYLILDCPRRGSAASLFVRKGDLRKISDRTFQRKAFDL